MVSLTERNKRDSDRPKRGKMGQPRMKSWETDPKNIRRPEGAKSDAPCFLSGPLVTKPGRRSHNRPFNPKGVGEQSPGLARFGAYPGERSNCDFNPNGVVQMGLCYGLDARRLSLSLLCGMPPTGNNATPLGLNESANRTRGRPADGPTPGFVPKPLWGLQRQDRCSFFICRNRNGFYQRVR